MLYHLLNRLSLYHVIDYFQQCGFMLSEGQVFTRHSLKARLNIHEKFLPFLNYMLSALHHAKFIKLDQDNIECLIKIKNSDFTALKNEILDKFPEKKSLIDLITYFSDHYRQALSGEIPGVGVLYPNANIHFLDPIVREMEEAANVIWFEKFLKKFLAIYGKKYPFCMMEVGGGMGRFTWKIIHHLQVYPTKYYFTDLSRFFILKAKEVATQEHIDFMEFATFDITKPVETQGFKEKSIHVLLAFNVVHATANLKATLSNLKSLLTPDGFLILVEYTDFPVWLHMIWGFAEGWWYFTDEYRKLTPLIKENDWSHVLLQANYEKTRVFPKKRNELSPLSLTGVIAA